MANDDRLADPTALTRALPVPTTTLATLDAAILAPAELAAAKAANTRRAYAADWADFGRRSARLRPFDAVQLVKDGVYPLTRHGLPL